MLFTVAIPVHNGGETIRTAVESCRNQDFSQDYEVIIIDNASQDSTVSNVKDLLDERTKLVEEKQLVTQWENHNRCMRKAKGNYILFCHADDYLLPSALTTIHRKLEERRFPNKYVLWGHSMFRDFEGALLDTHWRKNELIVGQRAYSIFLQSGVTPSGTCYSRKSFLLEGGFADLQNRVAPSDCYSMIKLAFAGFSFEMMDDMVFIRRFASTLTKNVDKQQIMEANQEGVSWLVNFINTDDVSSLLYPSYVKVPPSRLLYIFSYYKKYKKLVRNACIKFLLKKPTNIRNKTFMNALFRSCFARASK